MIEKMREIQSTGAASRLAIIGIAIIVVAAVTFWAGAVYVAWHFISKFW
jgi:flagellar basal body-associated protein FliL